MDYRLNIVVGEPSNMIDHLDLPRVFSGCLGHWKECWECIDFPLHDSGILSCIEVVSGVKVGQYSIDGVFWFCTVASLVLNLVDF